MNGSRTQHEQIVIWGRGGALPRPFAKISETPWGSPPVRPGGLEGVRLAGGEDSLAGFRLMFEIKPVRAGGGFEKEPVSIFRAQVHCLSDPFKGIPHHPIAEGNFVHGEVRLEHAALGPESLDDSGKIRKPVFGESL